MKKIIGYHCGILGWLILNLFLTTASQAGLEFVGFVQDGQGRVEGLAGADSVALSPDDKFVYVAASSTLTVLIRNPTSGGLVPFRSLKIIKMASMG